MALVYSCCFWFSLRLGGIIIGAVSMMQALIILSITCVGYSEPNKIQEKIFVWKNDVNLMFMKNLFENLQTDAAKTLFFVMVLTSIYIIICLLYIYGAYKCINVLMVAYIVVELIRLVGLSALVTIILLMLKQNTMDIGLLIGASVVGGFILLAMFYLWVCAANLPILINEEKQDEQEASIIHLQQLLKASKPQTFIACDDALWLNYSEYANKDKIFIISSNKQFK